jgi:4-amino-4-deoxy-L-arabinose transferase-like glycosyltransferase
VALGICLVAFALRVAAFFALGRAHHPDLWEYDQIATNLLDGRGFTYSFLGTTYRSYTEPLYPGLCALIYGLTGHSFIALGLVQAVLGALLVGLVFLCGRRLASDRAGLWAAALAALHPGLIVYTTKFHPFVLDAPLLLLVVTATLYWMPRARWSIALGAALGLCVLTRATILVTLPIIAWWLWSRGGRRWLPLVLATAALVVVPWVIRNYEVQHRFVLTRSGTGLVFWLGNNPHAFTGSATMAGQPLYDLLPADDLRHLRQLDELGQQEFFRDQALAYVRARPLAFLGRWAIKLGYFWWQSPQAGYLYPGAWFRVYQAYYLATLALAVFGILGVASGRERREIWLVAGVCLAISILQSAYYIEGRHRLAIEPMLLALAGAGIEALVARQLLPWGKKVSS